MAKQFVFPGRIDDDGKPIIDPAHRPAYSEARKALAGKRVEFVLRKPQSRRSLDQNAYAHKWPFPMIAEAMGEGIEAAKLCILGEKFGWHVVNGRELPIKPHTSLLTVKEFDELIEWMPPFALHMYGIQIPLPGEA